MTARLLGLTALCLVLAALVAITGERRGGVARPLVAPGLDAKQVTQLILMRPDAPDLAVALDGDHGPVVLAPAPGPADEAVVRDLVSAIAAARADRSAGGDGAWRRAHLEAPRLTVRLDRRGAAPIEVRVGDAQPASHQVWLGVAHRALLVPAWVGNALDRDLMSLRIRRPFRAATITGVELHATSPELFDLVLAGDPALRRDAGTSVRVAAAARARLYDALHALELDVLVAAPPDHEILTVRVIGGAAPAELHVYGSCPGHDDHMYVDGDAGAGCVSNAQIDELRAAAEIVAGPDGVAMIPLERMPLAIAVGDTAIERSGAAWTVRRGSDRAPADDDAIDALLGALTRPAIATIAAPIGQLMATWTVDFGGGVSETWRLYMGRGPMPAGASGTVLVRAGEPQGLVVDRDAARAMAGFGASLRSRTVLVIEATSLAAIAASGTAPAALVRGQSTDDWPGGDLAAIGRLREVVRTMRGTTWLRPGELGAARRTLVLTIEPEPTAGAQPTRHTIAIGAARAGGRCAATVDGSDPIELDAAACAALLAPLAS